MLLKSRAYNSLGSFERDTFSPIRWLEPLTNLDFTDRRKRRQSTKSKKVAAGTIDHFPIAEAKRLLERTLLAHEPADPGIGPGLAFGDEAHDLGIPIASAGNCLIC